MTLLNTLIAYTGFSVIALNGMTNAAAQGLVSHDMRVRFQPTQERLEVDDVISIQDLNRRTLSVALNRHLKISTTDKNIIKISSINAAQRDVDENEPVRQFSIQFKQVPKQFSLHYSGKISVSTHEGMQADGGIAAENILLGPNQAWYPSFYDNEMLSFRLRMELPAAWYAVTQGTRIRRQVVNDRVQETWQEKQAQTAIQLIAAPFVEYQENHASLTASVYLRQPDPALAQKYLHASFLYIDFYQHLFGDYPYAKFATVENTWNSGFGLPSYTLLGSQILRFPFILNSSFPHEILHNWWGNSVYVDYDKGNWSEGLTAYLADHLMKEQEGSAAQYRLAMLQNYHDFVDEKGDFSIAEFTLRKDFKTQAVGYNKTAMIFHMLRLRLGDSQFIAALRHFYGEQRFKISSFSDLEQRISEKSEMDLSRFFNQWVNRVGAPHLEIEQVEARKTGDNYLLTLTVQQRQPGAPYQLMLPLWIWTDADSAPIRESLALNQKQQSFRFNFKTRPLRVDVDPQYDVFRRLNDGEIPAALSQGFGSKPTVLLLPKAADKASYAEMRRLAQQWTAIIPQAKIVDDDSLQDLPAQANVWILGWNNRFRSRIVNSETGLRVNAWHDKMRLGDTIYTRRDHAVVIAGRRPAQREYTLLWLAADRAEVIKSLARKLPHYTSFSYLAFDTKGMRNQRKGKWLLQHTPMKFYLAAEQSHYQAIPARAPLASLNRIDDAR